MSSLLEELQLLEERLLALGPECSIERAEALLVPDFREFGASGRVLDREQVLSQIADAPSRTYAMHDVQVEALSNDAALLTYCVVVNGRDSIRSSIWVRRNGDWQMLFHQGTRTPQD